MSETRGWRRMTDEEVEKNLPAITKAVWRGHGIGYAEAVRDMIAEMEREFEPRMAGWLRDWAAERGIDLREETP